MNELPLVVPEELVEKAKVLDGFYIPTRYANGHPEGAPFEHYGKIHSADAWPDQGSVDRAVRSWSRKEARCRPRLLRLGYFGSYARGDWGVGSDLDLIAVVSGISLPFERRAAGWDLSSLPVPADLLVYSEKQWQSLQKENGRFSRMLKSEVVRTYIKTAGSRRA